MVVSQVVKLIKHWGCVPSILLYFLGNTRLFSLDFGAHQIHASLPIKKI